MNKKATNILHDVYFNAIVSLPMSQVADIHQCSKQYVSQVCKGYGLKVDKKRGVIEAPLNIIQQVFWPREVKQ